MNFSNFSFLESEFPILFNIGQNSPPKIRIDQFPRVVLANAFRVEFVGQEIMEYLREIGDGGRGY